MPNRGKGSAASHPALRNPGQHGLRGNESREIVVTQGQDRVLRSSRRVVAGTLACTAIAAAAVGVHLAVQPPAASHPAVVSASAASALRAPTVNVSAALPRVVHTDGDDAADAVVVTPRVVRHSTPTVTYRAPVARRVVAAPVPRRTFTPTPPAAISQQAPVAVSSAS